MSLRPRVTGKTLPEQATKAGTGVTSGSRRCVSELTVKCDDQKDAEPFPAETFGLFRVETGKGTSLVVGELDHATQQWLSANRRKKPSENQQKALEALQGFGDQGATFSEWRNAAGLARKTFQRARKSLLEMGLVEHIGNYYVCTDQGSL